MLKQLSKHPALSLFYYDKPHIKISDIKCFTLQPHILTARNLTAHEYTYSKYICQFNVFRKPW